MTPPTLIVSTGSRTRYIGPAIVALSAIVMLAWVWEKSPDPVIDFGREVYIPWRITQGDVLYRDINFFNGPLSQYLHAGVFAVFGPGIRTLVIFNAIVAALTCVLIYRIVLRLTDALTATVCGVVFFTLFAFAQQAGIPNYSWITSYSYDLSHGVSLAVLNLWVLSRYLRTGKRSWLCLTGVVMGLVFLTKAEVFFADAIAVVAGLALSAWPRGKSRVGSCLFPAALWGISVILPVATAFLALWMVMPGRVALQGLAGSWWFLGDQPLLELPFFRKLSGTDHTQASVMAIALWSVCLGVITGVAILLSQTLRVWLVPIVGAIGGGTLWWFWPQVNWSDVFRAAPVVLGVAGIVAAWSLYRDTGLRRAQSSRASPVTAASGTGETPVSRLVLSIACLLFAGALLGKIILNVNIARYGFALAMPATMVMIALFIGWLPRWCALRGWNPWAPRAVFLPLLAVTVYVHLRATNYWLSIKPVPVAEGRDFFFADSRGAVVDQAVQLLQGGTTDKDTVVCLPEGLLTNYLTRRKTSLAHLNFTPPALLMYGEDAMLADFQKQAPDYICLFHVDTSQDYGPRAFGIDYGQKIWAWIEGNYEPKAVLGAVPYTSDRFGILILKKR